MLHASDLDLPLAHMFELLLREVTDSGAGWVRFVNLMDGHIWIESEGLGKGCTATFIVKLGIPEQLNESRFALMSKMPINHSQSCYFPGLKVIVMDANRSASRDSFSSP